MYRPVADTEQRLDGCQPPAFARPAEGVGVEWGRVESADQWWRSAVGVQPRGVQQGVTTLIPGHCPMAAPFGILDHRKYNCPVLALNSLAS